MNARIKPNAGTDSSSAEVEAEAQWLTIDVAQIRPYARNPRRSDNREYARIKASIRHDGLLQPLVVTRCPNEVDFLVYAGGNTRLRALRELHAETRDPRFASVVCLCRPWRGESDVLLAHLKENELRGELSFLDKSQGVHEAKRLLEEERGDEPLGQAELVACLRERGYSVSQGRVSQMFYTVERLWPVMPLALGAGMGRPQVERIRALDRIAEAIWREHAVDTPAEYDAAFGALCQRYDAPDWDYSSLRQALEREIAERADLNVHAVALEFEARLMGRSVLVASDREVDEPDEEGRSESVVVDADASGRSNRAAHLHSAGSSKTARVMSSAMTEPADDRHGADFMSRHRQKNSASLASPAEVPPAARRSPRASDPAAEPCDDDELAFAGDLAPGGAARAGDLKSLRARLWVLATRLAQRHGLGDLIAPLPSAGLGYILRDVPNRALLAQLDDAALAQVSMVWWQLAACAEVLIAPSADLLPVLPEKSLLRRAREADDPRVLFAEVRTDDPAQVGYRLWRCLDDCAWQDLLDLMDAYRQLHRRAAAEGQALWGDGHMTATKESELVTAVLLYAMRCVAEGDQPALRNMRCGPQEVEALRTLSLADLYRVGALQAHCLEIHLSREVFWPMVRHLQGTRESEELQRDLIQRDAPLEMMHDLFGVGSREYTRLRRMLSVAPAVGRPPEPDESTAHALWRAVAARLKGDPETTLPPEAYLDLHRETGASLRAIWTAVQRWFAEGDTPGSEPDRPGTDRASTTASRRRSPRAA